MRAPEREMRPTAAAAGMALLAGLTWSVWSTTGSRLSLFVCIAALTVAVVDVVWAGVATRRVKLRVVANPAEATVGDTLRVTLAVEGSRQFVRVSMLALDPAPLGIEVPATASFSGPARTREVLSSVEVEVVSPGVAGLVAFARRRRVSLARLLFVGPRPVPAAEPFPELFRVWGDGEARPAPTGDLVRGVRPYHPGNPRRRVHWRATARIGELVVKEVDDVGAPRLLLGLDMGGGGLGGERAAGRAAYYALEGLRRGYQVALVTAERDARTVTAGVSSPSDVTRRLASASSGTPELPDDVSILLVTHRGDSWR